MRITGVRVYPVNLQVSPEFVITTTLGTHAFSRYVFVAIECSDGQVGWGEATVVPIWSGETQAGTLSLFQDVFTPLLLGRDPFDIEQIMQDLDVVLVDNIFSKASIEMALLDLVGQILNVPVYKLLGGTMNPHRIPIKFSIGLRDPEDAANIALEKVNEGFTAIKVKVGPNLDTDLARVREVRDAIGPDIRLNIDVNGGWSVKDSIRYIPQFYPFDLEYVEQPTPRWDIDGMAEVRRAVALPIMADETVFTVQQAMQVIKKEAADLISVYPGKNGGILKARTICKMAEAAGIGCHMGSNLEWDIATSAMCHLAVVSSNVKVASYPVDILGPLYYKTRLKPTEVHFGGGFATVPEGPGLGLAVDESYIMNLSKGGIMEPQAVA